MADLGRALRDALIDGQLEAVQTLLGQGANVDSRDTDEYTPLHWVAIRGHVEITELLLDRGASIDAVDVNNWTPLLGASAHGRLAAVKLLVAKGANINHKCNMLNTTLHLAAWYDRLDVCLFLLSKGADLTAVDGEGRHALSGYGRSAFPPLSPAAKIDRRDTLTAAWRAGPHPSQVQRRKEEAWDRRKSLMQVSAENGFRPLLHRQLAEKAVMVEDKVAAIPAIEIDTPAKRHAHLLGQVLSNEGIHRHIVSML